MKINYFFNWSKNGFSNVMAESKKDVMKVVLKEFGDDIVEDLGDPINIQPDADYEMTKKWMKMTNMD